MNTNNRGGRGGAYESRGGVGGGGRYPRGRPGYPGGQNHPPANYQQSGGDRYFNNNQNNNDRSRSREHEGGRGGGGRGGGGRGGGGRGYQPEYRPDRMLVKTNCFKLEFQSDGTNEWIMYHLQIQTARRVPILDVNTGEKVKDKAGAPTYRVEVKGRPFFSSQGGGDSTGATAMDEGGRDSATRKKEEGSTFLTRRILRQIQKELKESEGKEFVTDGTSLSYSPVRLFEGSMPVPEEKKPPGGVYGPADDGNIPIQGQQAKTIAPFCDYDVRVNVECDDEEMEAHERGKKSWFKVRFSEAGMVNFSVVKNKIETEQREGMVQCINLAIKNAMMMSMMAVGRSPRLFHFKPDLQTGELLSPRLFNLFQNNPDQRLLLSLFQAARFTASSDVLLMADFGSDWFRPEFRREQQPKQQDSQESSREKQEPIYVLQQDTVRNRNCQVGGKLAGIFIDNLEAPVPTHQRAEVEKALKSISFHVKYSCGDAWEKRCRDQGKSDDFIRQKRTFNRRNRRMNKPKESEGEEIMWAADDPEVYQFAVRRKDEEGNEVVGESTTVCDYYRERYDIKLKFPKMPLIRISDKEYFPVEFLRQALEKIRNANSEDQKKHTLSLNDTFAGSNRISHLEKILALPALQADESNFLQMLNLRMNPVPATMEAKVLPYPDLFFDQNHKAQVKKGSWNLRDVKFKKSADLDSFAVVDFAGGASIFLTSFFQQMKRHGVSFSGPDTKDALEHVTVAVKRDASPPMVHGAFQEAVQKAKDYFLLDKFGRFGDRRLFFATNAVNSGTGELSRVLVMPKRDDSTKVGLILPKEYGNGASHRVKAPHDPTSVSDARLVYSVVTSNGKEHVVDPFDLRPCSRPGVAEKVFEAKVDGRWEDVAPDFGIQYQLVAGGSGNGNLLREDQIADAAFICLEDTSHIECPSLVFVYLPDNDAQRYNFVKLLSYVDFGVQSQCIVKDKKNSSAQYQSNVAIKVNAKLSNSLNEAHSWKIADSPWTSEVPTLIMGFYMSSAQGQDSRMIVAASASLVGMKIAQDYRIQSKSPIIAECVMIDLVKSLALQFFLCLGKPPQRVLVYRAGGHDGLFQEIITKEMAAVRKAFYELNETGTDTSSSLHSRECEGKGCPLCTPIITFIVAQSQHNIRLVPNVQGRTDNVPSGTCVDDCTLMSPTTGSVLAKFDASEILPDSPVQLFQNADEKRFDFFLIAHGGLKGTSKAVYYRVLCNENYVFRPLGQASPLTKDVLQKLTYYMSFDYATATKAPRLIPVLLYSARLANVAMGYLNYLCDPQGGGQEPKYKPHREEDFTVYVRSESGDKTGKPDARTLMAFDPFNETGKSWCSPFHSHISA